MSERVCPYWVGYWLASPLRRLIHNPEKILGPRVTAGMTVLDIGPAMGFFTLPLARMVGPAGKVVCVDVQEAMLRSLQKRAHAARLADRIVARVCQPTTLCLDDFVGAFDFALAFAVVHEVPEVPEFFAELFKALKPGGRCLIAEPKGHVTVRSFEETVAAALQQNLSVVGRPWIFRCHSLLLSKQQERPL